MNHQHTLLAACLLVAVALATPAAGQSDRPGTSLPMDIAFFDSVAISPHMRSMIFPEVQALFRRLGVEVEFIDRARDPLRPVRTHEVRVILVAGAPSRWGLRERVMGTVLGGRRGTVYVFYPSVVRTLKRYRSLDMPGSGPTRLGTESRDVARAIARVMAHELIHTLTPGLAHAEDGLMQQKLGASDLVSRRTDVDPAFVSALQANLGAAVARTRARILAEGSSEAAGGGRASDGGGRDGG